MIETRTIEYVAQVLHLTPRQATKLCREQQIVGVFRQGKKWLVNVKVFDEWIESESMKSKLPPTI